MKNPVILVQISRTTVTSDRIKNCSFLLAGAHISIFCYDSGSMFFENAENSSLSIEETMRGLRRQVCGDIFLNYSKLTRLAQKTVAPFTMTLMTSYKNMALISASRLLTIINYFPNKYLAKPSFRLLMPIICMVSPENFIVMPVNSVSTIFPDSLFLESPKMPPPQPDLRLSHEQSPGLHRFLDLGWERVSFQSYNTLGILFFCSIAR